MSAEIFSNILIQLTFLGNIAIVLLVALFIIAKYKKWVFAEKVFEFLDQKALFLAFLVALASLLGSLYYSSIMDFEPCILCWWQRIFMYPLPLILGIALWKNDRKVKKYVISMTLVGGLISVYQYLTQMTGRSSVCVPGEISCTTIYTLGYGYITIPFMTLTAFLIIGLLTYLWRRSN